MPSTVDNLFEEIKNKLLNKKWIACIVLLVAIFLGVSSVFKACVENKEIYDKLASSQTEKGNDDSTRKSALKEIKLNSPKIMYRIQDEITRNPIEGVSLNILDSTYYSNQIGLISIPFRQSFVENTPDCFFSKKGYENVNRQLVIDTNQVNIIKLVNKK